MAYYFTYVRVKRHNYNYLDNNHLEQTTVMIQTKLITLVLLTHFKLYPVLHWLLFITSIITYTF